MGRALESAQQELRVLHDLVWAEPRMCGLAEFRARASKEEGPLTFLTQLDGPNILGLTEGPTTVLSILASRPESLESVWVGLVNGLDGP